MHALTLFALFALAAAAPSPAQRPFPVLPAGDDDSFLGWYDPRALGGRMIDVRICYLNAH
jgi:hypothetical protein